MHFYEDQYLNNLAMILNRGVRETNTRTKIETLRIPSTQIKVDMSTDFPILTSKKVAWKNAIDEMLWIYVRNENTIDTLRNPKIWEVNAWKDRTIGKSYGYQAGKTRNPKKYRNQLDYVIKTLKKDPSSRQAVIDLWDPEDLDEMALPPCMIMTVWSVIDGKLNCSIMQRSADYPLGVPFNTFQIGVLMHIIARELKVELGILTHNFADSHIYANQIEGVIQQLEQAKVYRFAPPTLKIAKKPWYKLTVEDFELENYECGPAIKFAYN